jgi:hypothetical protein
MNPGCLKMKMEIDFPPPRAYKTALQPLGGDVLQIRIDQMPSSGERNNG